MDSYKLLRTLGKHKEADALKIKIKDMKIA